MTPVMDRIHPRVASVNFGLPQLPANGVPGPMKPETKLPPPGLRSHPETPVQQPVPARSDAPPSSPAGTPRQETIFYLAAKSARNVSLALDLTGWEQAPIQMAKAFGGIWNTRVPLPPGRYRYRFLIDQGNPVKPGEGGGSPLPFGTLSGVVEVG